MLPEIEESFQSAQENVNEVVSRQGDETEFDGTTAENFLALGAALAATVLARRTLQAGWEKTFDRQPPKNPTSPGVTWGDALLWGAASGALVGLVRIASRRASFKAYRRMRS